MNPKHIEAAASQAGVSYEEALAKIHAARQLGQQNMAEQGKEDVCDPPMGIDTCQHEWRQVERGPTWELVQCTKCGEQWRHFDD